MNEGGAAWYFHTVGNSGLVDLRESQIKLISLFLISPEISKEDRPRLLGKLFFLSEKKNSAGMSLLPFSLPVTFTNIMSYMLKLIKNSKEKRSPSPGRKQNLLVISM